MKAKMIAIEKNANLVKLRPKTLIFICIVNTNEFNLKNLKGRD